MRNRQLATVLAHWPEDERRTLARLLDRLTDDIEKHRPECVGGNDTDHNKGGNR